MLRQTTLHACHVAGGAVMVPFGGWHMPLHYGSQIDEHHAVRLSAGMFDVSHMAVLDIAGEQATGWLQRLLANDVARMREPGQALYSCMLNPHGGVIDDLIIYRLATERYRLVVNAATRDTDMAWMRSTLQGTEVSLRERPDLGIIAVQGPRARELAAACLPFPATQALALGRFRCLEQSDWFLARTGYTGEDGWEIVLPASAAPDLWNALAAAGCKPCGLGARDTLRLEAGLNLYGQDMNQDTSPLESNLGWTVAWEPPGREFIGREALQQEQARGLELRLTGLVLEGRGVMRAGFPVFTASGEGIITSGGFSPTLQRSIALARLPVAATGGCEVGIRSQRVPARIVDPPFIRRCQVTADASNGESQ